VTANDGSIGEREIPDTNLSLAIVEALRELGLGPPVGPRGDPFDDDDGDGINARIEAVLKEPFQADALAKIKQLWWDHSQQNILYEVWPGWDGETEEFDIESLAGLEHCSGLEVINLCRFVGTDLSPLAKLPALRELTIYESLPSAVSKRNAAVLRSLTKRGVVIVIDTLKHRLAEKAAKAAARAKKANAKAKVKKPTAKVKKPTAKKTKKPVTRRTPSTRTGRRR
jgi:hypothetical protein